MTNEEFATRIKNGENLRLQLWNQVRRWIVKYAVRWHTYFGGRCGVELDDLTQSGYLAFEDAINDFDADCGSFLTYLTLRLKTAFAELYDVRTERGRHEPLNNAISLSEPISDDMEGLTFADVVSDPAANTAFEDVERNVFVEQLRAALEAALSDLTAEQADIMRRKYFFQQGEQEICTSINRSKNDVRRLTQSGLSQMRRLHGKALADFLDFNPYQSTGYGAWKNSNESVQEKYVIRKESIQKRLKRNDG